MNKPLSTIRVIEFEGKGPGPLAARLLADFGAEVTVIVRPETSSLARILGGKSENPIHRGKRVLALDLKTPAGLSAALEQITRSDALIEGGRPGVMERLGLGPDVCAAANPQLVYGRMTGWGQNGPRAQTVGHELNFLGLTGLLQLGARHGGRPMVPPTVLGDAAGGLGLAFGIASALLDARLSGRGRIVDAAILDVASLLGTYVHWLAGSGEIGGTRPSVFHDSPFYDTYECADGRYVAVAALEPAFYAELLAKLGLSDVDPGGQFDRAAWGALKSRLAAIFRKRTRNEWSKIFEGSDACVTPVLDLREAAQDPQNLARGLFMIAGDGSVQTTAAPRFLPLPPDE